MAFRREGRPRNSFLALNSLLSLSRTSCHKPWMGWGCTGWLAGRVGGKGAHLDMGCDFLLVSSRRNSNMVDMGDQASGSNNCGGSGEVVGVVLVVGWAGWWWFDYGIPRAIVFTSWSPDNHQQIKPIHLSPLEKNKRNRVWIFEGWRRLSLFALLILMPWAQHSTSQIHAM